MASVEHIGGDNLEIAKEEADTVQQIVVAKMRQSAEGDRKAGVGHMAKFEASVAVDNKKEGEQTSRTPEEVPSVAEKALVVSAKRGVAQSSVNPN